MPPFFRHSHTISIGFVLVLILMAAITVIGLTRMAAINERMNVIVSQHNVKTDLVGSMRNAARERSISLYRMALMTDPSTAMTSINIFPPDGRGISRRAMR